MSQMRLTFNLNMTGLDAVDAGMQRHVVNAASDGLDDLHRDILNSWSAASPSSPGEPPAKVTGRLERSIRKERRDKAGRFAGSKTGVQFALQILSPYAAALEFGYAPRNLKPRPFIRPAVYRLSQNYGKYFTVRQTFT